LAWATCMATPVPCALAQPICAAHIVTLVAAARHAAARCALGWLGMQLVAAIYLVSVHTTEGWWPSAQPSWPCWHGAIRLPSPALPCLALSCMPHTLQFYKAIKEISDNPSPETMRKWLDHPNIGPMITDMWKAMQSGKM
jgi:hypothetical protein